MSTKRKIVLIVLLIVVILVGLNLTWLRFSRLSVLQRAGPVLVNQV